VLAFVWHSCTHSVKVLTHHIGNRTCPVTSSLPKNVVTISKNTLYNCCACACKSPQLEERNSGLKMHNEHLQVHLNTKFSKRKEGICTTKIYTTLMAIPVKLPQENKMWFWFACIRLPIQKWDTHHLLKGKARQKSGSCGAWAKKPLRAQEEWHRDALAGLFELQRTGIGQLGAQTWSL